MFTGPLTPSPDFGLVVISSCQRGADVNGPCSPKLFKPENTKTLPINYETALKRLVTKHRRSYWKPKQSFKSEWWEQMQSQIR